MPQSQNNLDKAFDIVRAQGPVLPVEVASKLGVDSFLATAYLAQLVEAGKIKQTKERIGTSFIYHLHGQENVANARIIALQQTGRKTARMFAKDVPQGPEVAAKQRAFADRLAEIESKEAQAKLSAAQRIQMPAVNAPAERSQANVVRVIANTAPPAQSGTSFDRETKQEFLERFKPAIAEQLAKPVQDVRHTVSHLLAEVGKKILPRAHDGQLVEKALAFLVDGRADIISKDLKKKGRDADITATIPTSIGPMRFLIIVRDKKTISEADLSVAYTNGQNKKLPVIFVTNGKLTKNAQAYHQSIAGLVKMKNL
ncbi:MAG: hypothetical protein HYT16_03680 [DPANN group archaeon]|nr:hypothetical protein [DPANN group archaeon]